MQDRWKGYYEPHARKAAGMGKTIAQVLDAEWYDSAGVFERLLLPKLVPGSRVLEIACGPRQHEISLGEWRSNFHSTNEMQRKSTDRQGANSETRRLSLRASVLHFLLPHATAAHVTGSSIVSSQAWNMRMAQRRYFQRLPPAS